MKDRIKTIASLFLVNTERLVKSIEKTRNNNCLTPIQKIKQQMQQIQEIENAIKVLVDLKKGIQAECAAEVAAHEEFMSTQVTTKVYTDTPAEINSFTKGDA